jgi:GTP cyclohydrolase II
LVSTTQYQQSFSLTCLDEGTLRRTLFEETGGSYPELITRHDIKLFLPPIGGLTVYIFGDPAKMSDPNSKLALRVHDECNGSDVFGSDICTCRPYLTFGIEEAVKEAQNGGSGVVIYFRKEGRALGEVTKYLVYNARKRGEDRASEYFQRTENIAGVKDMRFQALMPDILHWLGITKIDRMLSMSNMKHDAIVDQGIPILERIPIPEDMIPADSRVEIDAKIQAGYCSYSLPPITPFHCVVILQHIGPLKALFPDNICAYADFCSYDWPCHVHGRVGKRKGSWLGRH